MNLKYRLIRSKRRKKTIALKINRESDVIIYAPSKTPEREIENFFMKNLPWIQKKILESKSRFPYEKSFKEGEEFFYLGAPYPLKYTSESEYGCDLRFIDGCFILYEKDKESIRKAFIEWYKEKAYEIVSEKVRVYSKLMGLSPHSVKITGALKRYGSCSYKNSICFSWRIVMAPFHIIDYVVVHELCHIKEKNHSQRFWGMVEKFVPDYRSKRAWLKENNHIFHF